MLELLKGRVGETAAPLIFLALFLVIVGGALYLTPRIAKWLDKRDREHKSYYDGMLTEDPNQTDEQEGERDGKTD